MTELQGEKDKFTITVGDFNTSFSDRPKTRSYYNIKITWVYQLVRFCCIKTVSKCRGFKQLSLIFYKRYPLNINTR